MLKQKIIGLLAASGMLFGLETVSFSDFEDKVKDHEVFKMMKETGLTNSKVKQDTGGMYILTGQMPKLTKNGEKKIQNVLTYITEDGEYFLFGKVVKSNGEKVELPVDKVDVSILKGKEDFSIGSGKKIVYIFTNPNCGGCKQLDTSLTEKKIKRIYC